MDSDIFWLLDNCKNISVIIKTSSNIYKYSYELINKASVVYKIT